MSIRAVHTTNVVVPGGGSLGPNDIPILRIRGQSNAQGQTPQTPPAPYNAPLSNVKIWTNAPFSSPDVYEWKNYEWGVTSNRREDTNPAVWGTTKFGYGPEMVCAKMLADYFGRDVYIIKSAIGGQPIAAWDNGAFLWNEDVSYTQNAIASILAMGKNPVFVGELWLQGEAQVVSGDTQGVYEPKFSSLIDRTRNNIDSRLNNMNFFAFALSVTYQTNVNPPGPGFSPSRATFNSWMANVIATKSNAFLINTDSIPNIATFDGTHYNLAAYLSMGQAAYNAIIANF